MIFSSGKSAATTSMWRGWPRSLTATVVQFADEWMLTGTSSSTHFAYSG